jgi:hypothetical protein
MVSISFQAVSNSNMPGTRGIIHLLTVLAIFAAAAAQAGTPRVQTAEEAINADAKWYAQSQGVSQAEAVRRLRIQSAMGDLIGRLRSTHKARLAGIVIDHKPTYRVRVRLTGTLPVSAQEHALGGSRLPVVFETGAIATLDALITSMTAIQDALKRLYPTLSGVGVDESTGEIVLYVYAPDAKAAAAAKARFGEVHALLGQPARIEITSAYPSLN